MKKNKILRLLILTVTLILGSAFSAYAQQVKILFTHDIHSNLDSKEGKVDGTLREYGGAARLSTLLKEHTDENTVYVDAGDIAMGTLYQAAYSTDAMELRMLGKLGCSVSTFGNHEFDYGCRGTAESLRAAMAGGGDLPEIVEASFDFSGELTPDQKELKSALDDYGCREYVIKEINGIRVAFFGIEGPDSIDCIQSDIKFKDYMEAAEETVEHIGDSADLIVCLSHTGTDGDGKSGEDFDLLRRVKGIDVVISGHSHTAYFNPVMVKDTVLGSCGCNLEYLGEMVLDVKDGDVSLVSYELIPIDESVEADPEILKMLDECKEKIKEGYLSKYADGGDYDDVLCSSDFDTIDVDTMYATHQEFDTGNLIADSYRFEAEKNGINDIDVFVVGLGTIRGSIAKGNTTLADAFEICSLGVGSDGSAGHPLLRAYITGEELELLVELDASLGPLVSSIKMSYSGLELKFNERRTLLDRVTDVYLVRPDGSCEEIEEDRLYSICCNMYAANMLGMLNGLTGGTLAIEPKYADGSPVEDFYDAALKDKNGEEIKEWIAFKDYLSSFEDGKIPETYHGPQGRKVRVSKNGMATLDNPGPTTIIFLILRLVIIAAVIFILLKIVNKQNNKAKNKGGNKKTGKSEEENHESGT